MTLMAGGPTLRRYREMRGMTQEGLARVVGVTLGSVANWESGRSHPHRETVDLVDEALEADGEIVAAFGYVTPGVDVVALRAQVAALSERVAVLASQVAELSGEVARGRGRSRRDGG